MNKNRLSKYALVIVVGCFGLLAHAQNDASDNSDESAGTQQKPTKLEIVLKNADASEKAMVDELTTKGYKNAASEVQDLRKNGPSDASELAAKIRSQFSVDKRNCQAIRDGDYDQARSA